jgi:CBS domain-containing protein
MICPYCKYENIVGADTCENCSQDLTGHEQPHARSAMELDMMEASITKLGPKPPVIVSQETTVAEVIDKLREHHIGCVLVGSVDKVVGIFSERDALLRVANRYEDAAELPITHFMTVDPEQLDESAPIAFALNRMSVGHFRHLPVTRDGKLEGIISLRDILRFLSEWYPDLIPAKP